MPPEPKTTFEKYLWEDPPKEFPIPEDVVYSLQIPVEIVITCKPRQVFSEARIKAERFKHYFLRRGMTPRDALRYCRINKWSQLMTDKKTEEELKALIDQYGGIPGPLRREMLRAAENKLVMENINGDEKQQRLAADVLKTMRTDPDLGMVGATATVELGPGLKSLFAKLGGAEAPQEQIVDASFEEVPPVKLIEGSADAKPKKKKK